MASFVVIIDVYSLKASGTRAIASYRSFFVIPFEGEPGACVLGTLVAAVFTWEGCLVDAVVVGVLRLMLFDPPVR